MNTVYNCNTNSTDSFQEKCGEIKLEVSEFILTPLTCASIINELIKCLLYQKSQIPYPYSWLKSVVSRKRKESNEQNKSMNFKVERHYNVVSTAYIDLENIMKNINLEFKNYGDDIKQVLILFGATMFNPKEIYTIKVEGLAKGHLEENHLQYNSKNQYKILKNIVFAQQWMTAMDLSIPTTNMYLLIQKDVMNNMNIEDSFFIPNIQYSPRNRTNHIQISLSNKNVIYNCCENLSIYEDLPNKDNLNNVTENCNNSSSNSKCNLVWCESKVVLRGFKECFVNGISASELW